MHNWGMMGDYGGWLGFAGLLVCALVIAALVKFVFFK